MSFYGGAVYPDAICSAGYVARNIILRRYHRYGPYVVSMQLQTDIHFENNVFDGRIYTWRDCLPCDRDGVIHYVDAWTGGYYDEGVTEESAQEWAEDTAWFWPWRESTRRQPERRRISADERRAARGWLARAAGGEGE